MDKQFQDIHFDNSKREEGSIVVRCVMIKQINFHPSVMEIIYIDHDQKECAMILPKLPYYKLTID